MLLPTGEARLAWTWARPYAVAHRVAAQAGADPWAFADETTAKKIVLAGFAAGVPATFRASASKSGTVTAPSPVARVYPAPVAPTRCA